MLGFFVRSSSSGGRDPGIALAVATETGVVMLIYLDQSLAEIKGRREAARRVLTRSDFYDAIMERAVERVRPIRRPIIIVAPLVIIVGIILKTFLREPNPPTSVN
jgi:Cu/Ag efflux pump CusA